MATYHCLECSRVSEALSLRSQVENLKNGTAFVRLQKKIESLTSRLEKEREQTKHVRDAKKEAKKNLKETKKELRDVQKKYDRSQKELKQLTEKLDKANQELQAAQKEIKELKETVCEQDKTIELLKSLASTADGTNSGIPTRKTPIGKKKVIPATERSKGNSKGGQVGHEPHFAAQFDENDPGVEVKRHIPEDTVCPCCGKPMKYIRSIKKSEADIEVKLKKTLHLFDEYGCEECGETVHEEIPEKLSGTMYYGETIQAIILELMAKCNVTMEAASGFIGFILNHEIDPSAGYAAKLPIRAAEKLRTFSEAMKIAVLSQPLLYWDDTVINIMTHQACFRFYGTETLSLYKAHWTKSKETVEKDGILAYLDSTVFLMHDHVTHPYNTDFIFMNLECIVHLIRALNGLNEISKHKWLSDILSITRKAIHDRKALISEGKKSFDNGYLRKFWEKYRKAITLGYRETSKDTNAYYHKEECALLVRLQNYAANYYAWLVCFDLPTSDNLSERSLRFVKSRLSISGQFESIDSAEDYALIQTYIRTCEKNGIDLMDALIRVFQGNPYTLEEVLGEEDRNRYLKYRERVITEEIIERAPAMTESVFSNTELMKEEYLERVYAYMSAPHTSEELVDILTARGDVKNLFKSDEVDQYKEINTETETPEETEAEEPSETGKETSDTDKSENPEEEKADKKKNPLEPIRRRQKKANGRPRKSQPVIVASGAPPG